MTLAMARTLLFVPGDRPERFGKAEASRADGIVLDLEDAVSPENKDAARSHVASWLAQGKTAIVRINAVDTPWFADDLAAAGAGDCTVMLPKASVDGAAAVVAALGSRARVLALVETAAGIVQAASICAAPNVIRAAFGSIDLSTEIGVDADDREALLYARSAVVLGSVAAAIAPPVDGVTTDLSNPQRAGDDAGYAARLGFSGKLCIHPSQVDAVHTAFAPTAAQIAWAQRILATTGGGAAKVDGKMVDAPVRERARRLLNRHDPTTAEGD